MGPGVLSGRLLSRSSRSPLVKDGSGTRVSFNLSLYLNSFLVSPNVKNRILDTSVGNVTFRVQNYLIYFEPKQNRMYRNKSKEITKSVFQSVSFLSTPLNFYTGHLLNLYRHYGSHLILYFSNITWVKGRYIILVSVNHKPILLPHHNLRF